MEEQEIKRKEKELVATVRLPAEAESYRVETIAQGKRTQVRLDMMFFYPIFFPPSTKATRILELSGLPSCM